MSFCWDFWLATPQTVKVGIPVMLLRSLHPPRLMNETRCLVVSCRRNVIEVEVAVGPYAGERHIILRITLQPSESKLPFQFQRKQFPIQPCFAMTINKSQGQSLKKIGLHLHQPLFSHGMLYVALSRTGNNKSIFLHCTYTRPKVAAELGFSREFYDASIVSSECVFQL